MKPLEGGGEEGPQYEAIGATALEPREDLRDGGGDGERDQS